MTEPKVSVCLITYNHELFIAQALEGILEQRTDFLVEIVVGDDCSTDQTREILIEYQRMFPERIKLLLWEENQGLVGKNNLVKTLAACTGEYIAFLEGDDYWIDPDKLHKQVAFLDAHPECSMCAHNTQIILNTSDNIWGLKNPPGQKQFYDLEDVLEAYAWHTSSVLCRNGLYHTFPDWFYRFPGADWPMYIMAAQKGKIAYLDQVMSVYRIHGGGMWSSRSLLDVYQIDGIFFKEMHAYLGPSYRHVLLRIQADHFKKAGQRYVETNVAKSRSADELRAGAEDFLNTLFQSVDLSSYHKRRMRRKFYAGFYGALGFHCYEDHNLNDGLKYLLLASRHDPAWLGDKGVWSVLGESLFGKRIADYLRQRL